MQQGARVAPFGDLWYHRGQLYSANEYRGLHVCPAGGPEVPDILPVVILKLARDTGELISVSLLFVKG